MTSRSIKQELDWFLMQPLREICKDIPRAKHALELADQYAEALARDYKEKFVKRAHEFAGYLECLHDHNRI